MPNDPESLARWQGKIDAFVETFRLQIDTLFKAIDVVEERIKLVGDESQKDVVESSVALSKDVHELRKEHHILATKLSNLIARLTVIVAICSFIGTVVTSLFVAIILKVFMK